MTILSDYTHSTVCIPVDRADEIVRTSPQTTWVRPYDYILVASVTLTLFLWAVTGIPLSPFRPWLTGTVQRNLFYIFACVVLIAFVRSVMYVARGGRFRRRFLDATLVRHFGWRPLFGALRYIVLCSIVLTVYSSIKQAIPLINPHRYDDALVAVERAVHFGWNPAWSLIASNPPTWWLSFLDYAYYTWFPFMPMVAAYFLVHRNRAKRDRYFAAFMSVWIIADLIGLLIPSHGPCYVDPNTFPPTAMYLCSMTQDWLWMNYSALNEITLLGNGNMEFGCGLMAMPSLHVIVVGLYVTFLWDEGRWLRYLSIAYAALVLIGSVYSGWHYAIDGYVGFAIAFLVTWAVGKLPGAWRRPVGT